MFRRIDDFLQAWQGQSESTAKYFALLDDENIGQTVVDGHRSLGQIAWHIVTTLPEMMNQVGLGLASVGHETMPPSTAAEIAKSYEAVAKELAEAVKSQWDDAKLEEVDSMYGMDWPKGLTLRILIDHEIHHRGQMNVLLRQAGVKPPGIHGPAKEEWKERGMDEPPY